MLLDNAECCFVCRRRADGLGVNYGRKVAWLCQECCDGRYGVKGVRMSVKEWDLYEARALVPASDAAGSYLDQIGKTDLSSLNAFEWREMFRVFLDAYGPALRSEVNKGARG